MLKSVLAFGMHLLFLVGIYDVFVFLTLCCACDVGIASKLKVGKYVFKDLNKYRCC